MKNERDSNHRFMNQLQSGYWKIAKFGHWPNVAIALSVIGLYILVGAKALMGVLAIGSVMIAVGYFQQLMTVAYQFLQQVAMFSLAHCQLKNATTTNSLSSFMMSASNIQAAINGPCAT